MLGFEIKAAMNNHYTRTEHVSSVQILSYTILTVITETVHIIGIRALKSLVWIFFLVGEWGGADETLGCIPKSRSGFWVMIIIKNMNLPCSWLVSSLYVLASPSLIICQVTNIRWVALTFSIWRNLELKSIQLSKTVSAVGMARLFKMQP